MDDHPWLTIFRLAVFDIHVCWILVVGMGMYGNVENGTAKRDATEGRGSAGTTECAGECGERRRAWARARRTTRSWAKNICRVAPKTWTEPDTSLWTRV